MCDASLVKLASFGDCTMSQKGHPYGFKYKGSSECIHYTQLVSFLIVLSYGLAKWARAELNNSVYTCSDVRTVSTVHISSWYPIRHIHSFYTARLCRAEELCQQTAIKLRVQKMPKI